MVNAVMKEVSKDLNLDLLWVDLLVGGGGSRGERKVGGLT